MFRALRLLAVAPILLVLALAGSSAGSVIPADELVREAVTEMSSWSASGIDPAIGTWESVQGSVREAVRLRPYDATAHERLGLLGTMRRESPERFDEGMRHLVVALELRPVSSYSWVNIGVARYLKGEPASSVEPMLLQAARLGPSEPAVQRAVVDYGLALWPDLSPEGRAEVDRMLAAGLRRNPLEMLRISERRGRLEAACRHVVGAQSMDRRIGRTCERWEITP